MGKLIRRTKQARSKPTADLNDDDDDDDDHDHDHDHDHDPENKRLKDIPHFSLGRVSLQIILTSAMARTLGDIGHAC